MLDLFLGIILIIAIWTDLKEEIIPNRLTFSLMFFGIIINLYLKGWPGILFSLKGLFLGLIIFLLPFILGGMGAGDVKLVAGIGAIKGAKFIFIDSLGIGVIGGIISLFIMLKHGKLKDLIDKFIYRIPLKNLLNRQENDSFGYSIPIVLGTWLLLLFR